MIWWSGAFCGKLRAVGMVAVSNRVEPGLGRRDVGAAHGGGLPVRWIVSRLPVLIVALASVAGSELRAQEPPQQARPQPAPIRQPIDPQKLDDLLKTWEANSARLRTLDVRMARTDRSPAWDEDDHYEGRAMFKSPNLAWLDFQKEKEI